MNLQKKSCTINASVATSVCAAGQTCPLRFRFLAGTQDATCGNAVGATMYVDGINVVTSATTDAIAEYIVEHLEYQNTSNSPTLTKTYTITLRDNTATDSSSANIYITKADTQTSITGIAPEPSVYGQNYTVSVAVSAVSPSIGTPDGSVTVSDGEGHSCSITLSGGAGSCALPSTPTGTRTITAQYAGALGYNASSAQGSHQVIKASTTSSVTRTVSSPVYGQPIGFGAQVAIVAPGSYTPAGSVQFYLNGGAYGSPAALSGGSASSQLTSTLNTGTYTYYVEYLGDANNYGSDSLPAAQFGVIQNTTTITVASSSPSSTYGQPVHLTAVVDEVLPSIITPTGQVQFYVDSAAVGEPVDLVDGQAVSAELHTLLPDGHLLIGQHTFSASYLGNSNSKPSDSAIGQQTITPVRTGVVITPSENPTVYGTSLTMTIQVTVETPSLIVPAGQVQLYIDGVRFGSPITLDSSAQAVRLVPYLNVWPGTHQVTAFYTSTIPTQVLNSDNTAQPLVQIVHKANPVITIEPQTLTPTASEAVSYTVLISHSMPTQGTPTGSVQFYIDGAELGGPVALDDTGFAHSPQAARLNAGEHAITVGYSGDDYFLSVASSDPYTQAVTKADATVAINAVAPLAVVVGQPATVSVQVLPISPAVEIPSGSVIISNGSGNCSATLDASGAGTCQLVSTAPGSPDITAAYQGSANFNEALSDPFSGPVVSKADSAVSITGYAPLSPITGQTVAITFSVTAVAPGFATPTGVVTITDGTGRSCSADVTVGWCEITFDEAGAVTLNAAYTGDSNLNPSQQLGVSILTIAKASTTSSLVQSLPSSVYGQPVTFTAAVSVQAPGIGVPSGSMQFFVDGASVDAVQLENGSTSWSSSTLPVGSHAVSAAYLGDSNYSVSTASAVTQTVAKADTTLSLITNQNPSPYGIPVLATAYVTGNAPSTAVPVSGTVQFYIDDVAYGAPVKVGSDGSASKLLPYTALWVGTHSVTAVYSGDANFNGSDNTADPLMQVIEKGSLTVLLDFTVDAPVFGQAFGMTATFTGDGPNTPLPTGTLQFNIDGADLGAPVTLDAAATAVSDLIDSLAVGTHAVTLSYSGDDTYAAAIIDIPSAIAVLKADTSIAITGWSPDSGLVVGQPLTVTYQVSVTAPGAGTPTGTVTVSNGIDSCFASLAAGGCQLTPTSSGVQQLTATYSGNGSFNSSSTAAPVEGPTYDKASTAVTIETSVNPQGLGLPVSFTAAVQAEAPGGGVPDGMAQFKIDGVELGSPVTLINGSATSESTSDLAAGLHTVTAHYLGSSGYLESDAEVSQRVVEGCLGTATPEAGGLLICRDMQSSSPDASVASGEQPLTTTIEIPAGAVASKVTLVYNRLNGSLLARPAGTDFAANFTLDVYIESALQSAYTFTAPISITTSYIPDNWDTSSFMVQGWDGSAWSANGLAITSNNPDEHTVGFTMQNVGAQEYALTGEHEYLIFLPFFIH